MKRWVVLPFSMMLAACATAPVTQRPEHLFNDHLFVAATERISADDVFARSDEMKQYLSAEIAGHMRVKGRQQGLFDALTARAS
jgi:hypothetical protein